MSIYGLHEYLPYIWNQENVHTNVNNIIDIVYMQNSKSTGITFVLGTNKTTVNINLKWEDISILSYVNQ